MDVLVLIVRGCRDGTKPAGFVSELFPSVVHRILSSDDPALLQVCSLIARLLLYCRYVTSLPGSCFTAGM